MSGSDTLQEHHIVVQQHLGRFLLQVQRYEMLLKALVIDSVASGTVETAPTDLEKPTFHTSFALELSAEDLGQTRARLETFKNLRNRIVHHLLEEHDLATQASCESALALLAQGIATAQASYAELHQWATTTMEAQQQFAAFVQGPQFDEFLHGILPDGTVDWPNCRAVRLLRRQEEQTPPGEMTRLDEAVAAIRTSHPGHSPRKYFCSNWRELLAKCGEFEIRKEKGSADERGVTWYRSLGSSDGGCARLVV